MGIAYAKKERLRHTFGLLGTFELFLEKYVDDEESQK